MLPATCSQPPAGPQCCTRAARLSVGAVQEPLKHKRHRVEELLEMLALQGCANSFIGDSLARGISGGQVHEPCLA